jgi:hypothetical protein
MNNKPIGTIYRLDEKDRGQDEIWLEEIEIKKGEVEYTENYILVDRIELQQMINKGRIYEYERFNNEGTVMVRTMSSIFRNSFLDFKVSRDGEVFLRIGVCRALFKACQNKYFCYPFGYITLSFGFEV